MTTATLLPSSIASPKGRFLTGNLTDFNRDRLGFLTHCAREYGDVVLLHLGPLKVYLFNHPKQVEEILVTKSRNLRKSQAYREVGKAFEANGLLTSDGDFWRKQRKLVLPAFHGQRINTLGEIMVDLANQEVSTWQDGTICDIHQGIMNLTSAIVVKALFNTNFSRNESVDFALRLAMKLYSERLDKAFLIPDWLPTPANNRTKKAIKKLNNIVSSMINQRKAEINTGKIGNDFLSMLIQIQDEKGNCMNEKDLRSEVMTMFIAGYETAANSLAWTWYLLAEHPEIEAKLFEEVDSVLCGRTATVADLPQLQFTEMIMKESLRLYSPAWLTSREVINECEIGGHHLPVGTTVFTSQWVIHRDPRFFDQPEEFNPNRWANNFAKTLPSITYFPFGAGQRVCLGQSFAMMETTLILATVAQKFQLKLIPDQKVEPWSSFLLRPKNGIKMLLNKR